MRSRSLVIAPAYLPPSLVALALLAVIQVCDSDESFLQQQAREEIQNRPKLGQDLGHSEWHKFGPKHWASTKKKSYLVAAASAKHLNQPPEEEQDETGSGPDQRKRRDQSAETFITVSADVKAHLSQTGQPPKVNKPRGRHQPADKSDRVDRPDTWQLAGPQIQQGPPTGRDVDQLLLDSVPPGGGGGGGGGSIHSEASLAKHRAGKLVASGASYARRQQAQAPVGPDRPTFGTDQLGQMYFDTASMPLEVAAHVGQTAYLVCRLRSIHNQQQQPQNQRLAQDQAAAGLQVSWRRNMQILTSGLMRFTSDERYQASHVPGSNDWVLEVHNVQASDEGSFECQVNSEPKPASVSLVLRTMLASIEILEAHGANGRRLQVQEDDQIRLTCRVDFRSALESVDDSTTPTEAELEANFNQDQELDQAEHQSGRAAATQLSSQHYIFWYKEGISLEYNNPRGGVKLESRNQAHRMEKVLTLEGASSATDSGTYMCKIQPELSDIAPAQLQVIVGDGGRSSAAAVAAPAARSQVATSMIINLFLFAMLWR